MEVIYLLKYQRYIQSTFTVHGIRLTKKVGNLIIFFFVGHHSFLIHVPSHHYIVLYHSLSLKLHEIIKQRKEIPQKHWLNNVIILVWCVVIGQFLEKGNEFLGFVFITVK